MPGLYIFSHLYAQLYSYMDIEIYTRFTFQKRDNAVRFMIFSLNNIQWLISYG